MPEERTSRVSGQTSEENAPEERDGLLTESQTAPKSSAERTSASRWSQLCLFIWATLATAAFIVLAVLYQHEKDANDATPINKYEVSSAGKRNLIFMVSDGMGPASLSLTRSFRQHTDKLPANDTLLLDKYLIGESRTRSTSSLITDSAAGATAFSCAQKSYNGAISVLPGHTPCGTVMEAAKMAGYMTGLVVTTRITDATPACFVAHANHRSYEDLIAEHEIGEYPLGRVVDLMLGGGRCHFLPNSTHGSCRKDDKDLVKMAQKKGFSYVDDKAGFDALKGGRAVKLPLMGLFAQGDIPFEVDRRYQNDKYPSLEETTRTALTALKEATKDSDKGFFIMIEGSRIDHAGHGNDPVAQVHEVLAYDQALKAVLEFIEEESTPTVVVSTSDHETGGLSVARQLSTKYPEYRWYPEMLARANHSAEYLHKMFRDYLRKNEAKVTDAERNAYIRREIIEKGLGITDATDAEIKSLVKSFRDHTTSPSYIFADMISRRAQVGWSSHGHSAVDVNIYANPSKETAALLGNHENTEVGEFLANYLSVDVDKVTEKLKDTATKQQDVSISTQDYDKIYPWMGPHLSHSFHVDTLDNYHGEFRRRDLDEFDCGCGYH